MCAMPRLFWLAAQQPHIREVPVKSEQQQACLALHRMRAQLMKMRIMQTNALRGLLGEFGIVLPEGHRTLGCSASPGEMAPGPGQAARRAHRKPCRSQLSRVERLQPRHRSHRQALGAALGKHDQHMAGPCRRFRAWVP